MKKLIIIPAYNEEKNLVSLIDEIQKYDPDFHYIIINDGSNDNTGAICAEKKYNAIHLPLNLGIGAAVQTGYLYAIQNALFHVLQNEYEEQKNQDQPPDNDKLGNLKKLITFAEFLNFNIDQFLTDPNIPWKDRDNES